MFISLGLAPISASMLWYSSSFLLASWFGLLFFLTAWGIQAMLWARHFPLPARGRFFVLYLGALALNNLLWVSIGLLFVAEDPLPLQILLFTALAGMAVLTIPLLTSTYVVYVVYLMTSVFPITVWFFSCATEVHVALGMLGVLLTTGLLFTARSYHQNLRDCLRLPADQAPLMRAVTQIRETPEAGCTQTEAGLVRQEERVLATLQSIGDGVVATDTNGIIDYLNPRAALFTGWAPENARGQPFSKVVKLVEEATQAPLSDPVKNCVQQGTAIKVGGDVLLVQRGTHKKFCVEITATPILHQHKIIGSVLILHDVTELRGMARQISYQATHDRVTGLMNRNEFEHRIEQAIENTRVAGRGYAFCYLDLDQFKVINDSIGHRAGDTLLRQLADYLALGMRPSDALARLGGDEFGVLRESASLEEGREIAESLRLLIRDFDFRWEGKAIEVRASIGLVPLTAQYTTIVDVLSAADSACYVAKEMGRNRVHVYCKDDVALVQHHGYMRWVRELRKALSEQYFRLYLQCIVPLQGEHQRPHAEVLLRFQGDTGEIVVPQQFIPAAERYHLMPEVDRWVILHTLQFLKKNPLALHRLEVWSINLSGQSLGDERFLDFVLENLERSAVAPEKVCFEITETAAITNFSRASHFIATLTGMGCQFVLDDFGSGLSSFSYLKNLPVHALKIDGSFVRDMRQDTVDYAMVESINQVGHVMGIRTIAECVENQETLLALRKLGVDYVQGYAISYPMPIEWALCPDDPEGTELSNWLESVIPP